MTRISFWRGCPSENWQPELPRHLQPDAHLCCYSCYIGVSTRDDLSQCVLQFGTKFNIYLKTKTGKEIHTHTSATHIQTLENLQSVPLLLWQFQLFVPFYLTMYSLKKLGHLYHRFHMGWGFQMLSYGVAEHVPLNLPVN